MLDGKSLVFAFASFRLFVGERRLEKDGERVHLGGRALDLLVFLVEHAGEIVANREILDRVWPNVTVGDDSLRFHIKNIRRALGDDRQTAAYVRSVSGRGYCFTARVERSDMPEPSGASVAMLDARSNLPTRSSAIVGRADNLDAVSRELLRRRQVTIAGPGGIGKTTLAIATADALRAKFDDAVFFVDLAPIENPSLVIGAVASALGRVQAEEPTSALIASLRDCRILIVLDNCEQVIGAVADLADRLVRETVGVHLLVTSRETLRISSERVHRLMPLECPPDTNDLPSDRALSYAAVALFVDRTSASIDEFVFDDTLAPVVGEICRRLDGIPLAIELAAARVELLGLSGLARGLNDMFAVLTQGRRFALPRHQTLRATLDWSYHLLSPVEQAVLQDVSLFRATFTFESAIAVVQDGMIGFQEVVEAMGNLVSKSMLTAGHSGQAVHYRLLEATRIYASEKLALSGGRQEAAIRHAGHHLQLMEAAPVDWWSEAGTAWLQSYTGRVDDIRAALDWCLSGTGDLSTGLRLTIASARLWFRLSLLMECRDRIEVALRCHYESSRQDPIIEMRLQAALGHALWYSVSSLDRLERAFGRSLTLAEQLGDVEMQLQSLWGLWAARRAGAQFQEALTVATTYEIIARASGDGAAMLLAARILGLTHHFLGHQQIARELFEQVLEAGHRAGNAVNSQFQLSAEIAAATALTRIMWLQGFPDQAAAMLRDALEAAQRTEHWFATYHVVCFAGCPLALWFGDLAQAQRHLSMTGDRKAADRLSDCWAAILRLRQTDERGALIAASFEPRVDLHTSPELATLAAVDTVLMPRHDQSVDDQMWNSPEVLRVNAELLLWHDAPGAAAEAEAVLLRSIELAREQSALSWELRAATSLGRLLHRSGRVIEARTVLASTYDRFTEGFGTSDLTVARGLIAAWS